MQLDTETAKKIMTAFEQCNVVVEEAMRCVVELMQESIEYRERIAELEETLWYLIGDVEAAHRSHIPAPGDPPITDKEIANLLRAQSLLANYRPT